MELYAIRGPHHLEYLRAMRCIAQAYREAQELDLRATPDGFAMAVLARLVGLDPPMVVVTLDEPPEPETLTSHPGLV